MFRDFRPGSSPLARGLLLSVLEGEPQGGIIPARAGFTSASSSASGRSPGSSPLARGLLEPARRRHPRRGIIPARAGFTQSRADVCVKGGDHPRSRGVYLQRRLDGQREGGSSPLARGLQVHVGDPRRQVRIIPARAGFTGIPYSRPRYSGDHPRSRGVYPKHSPGLPPWTGSSPLARGLPPTPWTGINDRRIIPARAGFTACPAARSGRPADHPRSRGVYACGSLVSQRTRSLPDPRRLHCRPRARSAGSP